MNIAQAAEAANMAANRTAYSLAREVIGLRAQVAEQRDTLAKMEAEDGKEITALEQEIEAYNDIASDLGTLLDLVRRALNVNEEPHQSLDERLLEAAEGIKAERDALAAHLQRIGDAWLIDDTGIHEIHPDHVRLLKARYEAVNDAILGAPTTSLDRRDAQLIADALGNLLSIARKCSTGYLVETIETNIAHLRRQAAGDGK